MAFNLDTNILLSGRGTDVGGSIIQGLKARGIFDQLQQSREQAPARQQILEGQLAEAQQVQQQSQLLAQQTEQNRVIDSIAGSYGGVKGLVDSGKFNDAADALEANRAVLAQSGVTNFEDTDLAIAALRSGDPKQIREVKLQGEQAIQISEARREREIGTSAADRGFEKQISGFTEDEKVKARKIKAGLDPRAVGSSQVTLAETGKTETVAESQAIIEQSKAEARERGKLSVQKGLLPEIKAAIKLAEKEAQARGETASELISAKAAMPGLRTVVSNLKALSGEATFTLAGRGFNAVAKELGFSTKGDTARASMVAMVDNQVLPLLKPIFGAAFTAAEGDRLRNAFLDPDSTPDSRTASLDAFLAQMERNIEAKELEISLADDSQAVGAPVGQDTGITEEQFRAMTPQQRAAALQQLGGGQ